MMLTLNFRRLVLVSLIGFAFAAESFAVDGDSRPLLLAQNGETRYVIVVAADAHDAERDAVGHGGAEHESNQDHDERRVVAAFLLLRCDDG